MQAVIQTGGKQYVVSEGDVLEVERLASKEVALTALLVFEEGQAPKTGGKVTAKVLGEAQGDKLVVFKMKPKKRYRVKTGHRQKLSRVQIDKITA